MDDENGRKRFHNGFPRVKLINDIIQNNKEIKTNNKNNSNKKKGSRRVVGGVGRPLRRWFLVPAAVIASSRRLLCRSYNDALSTFSGN